MLLPSLGSAQGTTKVRQLLGQGWTFLEAGNLRKAEESFAAAFEDPVGRSSAEVYYAVAAVWWERRNAMAAYMWLSDAGKAGKESLTWDGGPGGEWDQRIESRRRYVEANFTVVKLRAPKRGKPLPPLADPTPNDPLLREFTDRLPTVVEEGVEADVAVQWVLLPNGTYWIGEELVDLSGGELDASKAASWDLPADRGKAKAAYAVRVAALAEGRSMAREAGAAADQAQADARQIEAQRKQEEDARKAELEAERQAALAQQARELEAERVAADARRQADLRRAEDERAEKDRRREQDRLTQDQKAQADRAADERRAEERREADLRRAEEDRRRAEAAEEEAALLAQREAAAERDRQQREADRLEQEAQGRDERRAADAATAEQRRREREQAEEEARLADARLRQEKRDAAEAEAKAREEERWAAAARDTAAAEDRRGAAARDAQARREGAQAAGDAADELRGRRFYLAAGGGLSTVDSILGGESSVEADWSAHGELGVMVPIGKGAMPVALAIGLSYDSLPVAGCSNAQTRGNAVALHLAPRLAIPLRDRIWLQGRAGIHVGAVATWPSARERQSCAEHRPVDGGVAYGVQLSSNGSTAELSYSDLGWGGYGMVLGPDFEIGILGAPGKASSFMGVAFFLRHDQVFAAIESGDYHFRSAGSAPVDLETVELSALDAAASMPRFQLGARAMVLF